MLSSAQNLPAIAEAIGELPSFLPAMLRLPTKLQERACETELIQAVLNSKLSGRPAAVLVVYVDLLLLVAVLPM